jgi:serine/threonine protein phosphatase PrpC
MGRNFRRWTLKISNRPGAPRALEVMYGATLTAVLFYAGCTHIAEVGDSRAYVPRRCQPARLTRDQSYVQRLLDA